MYQTYNIPPPVLLSVMVVLLAILTSCGGGTDSTATAESADGTKEALAVSGSSAVPPGWTGRAPKYEVINGITVPPEPAPAMNNATIAGVDVNANGVRDDVERALAKKSIIAPDISRAAQKTITSSGDTAAINMIYVECGVGLTSIENIKQVKAATYIRNIDSAAYTKALEDFYDYKERLPKQTLESWISDCDRLGVK